MKALNTGRVMMTFPTGTATAAEFVKDGSQTSAAGASAASGRLPVHFPAESAGSPGPRGRHGDASEDRLSCLRKVRAGATHLRCSFPSVGSASGGPFAQAPMITVSGAPTAATATPPAPCPSGRAAGRPGPAGVRVRPAPHDERRLGLLAAAIARHVLRGIPSLRRGRRPQERRGRCQQSGAADGSWRAPVPRGRSCSDPQAVAAGSLDETPPVGAIGTPAEMPRVRVRRTTDPDAVRTVRRRRQDGCAGHRTGRNSGHGEAGLRDRTASAVKDAERRDGSTWRRERGRRPSRAARRTARQR